MSSTQDPHVGTWVLNPSQSAFDRNHRPQSATLVIARDDEGRYLVTAEGLSETGQQVTERPQTLVPDGVPRPVPDFPGLSAVCTRADAQTLHTDVTREDGSIAGQSTFVVSSDGRTLTAISSGFDSQLRQFKQQTIWERQRAASSTRTALRADA